MQLVRSQRGRCFDAQRPLDNLDTGERADRKVRPGLQAPDAPQERVPPGRRIVCQEGEAVVGRQEIQAQAAFQRIAEQPAIW